MPRKPAQSRELRIDRTRISLGDKGGHDASQGRLIRSRFDSKIDEYDYH